MKTILFLLALLMPQPATSRTKVQYVVGFRGYVNVDDVPTSIGNPGHIDLPQSVNQYWNCLIGDAHTTNNSVYRNVICNFIGTPASVVSTVICPTDHEGKDSATLGLLGDKTLQTEKVMVYLECDTMKVGQ